MQHTANIKMHATIWAILGVVSLACVSPMAHGDSHCQSYWTAAYKCSQGCGCGGTSGGGSRPSRDYAAERRAQEAAAERQRQQAEADRIERERLAEEKRQKDAAFIRDRDAAANTLKGSTGAAMNQLKGLSGTGDSGLKGSDFDAGSQLKSAPAAVIDTGPGSKSKSKGMQAGPKNAPHTDTSVVDARVARDGASFTNQVPELKRSPAADRINKGFQAVINHDWPVALAWWQDALNRDPGNAALKRSVDLAQWMVDRRKANAAGPATPLGAALHSAARGDSVGAIRQFELAKSANPAIAAQADSMIVALKQKQAQDAKAAAHWNGEIKKGTQRLVDGLFETGMNRLSIGDEKGAQEAFNDATFYGLSANVRPSQLPATKPEQAK